jgi:peptidoglycan-associated lipoprotein
MVERWILPLYSWLFLGFIFVAGCATGTVGGSSSSPRSGIPSSSEVGEPNTIGSGEISTSAQSRSLEAFQKGQEIPSTSSSSTGQSNPLKDVYFEFDRFALRPEARQTLQGNAQWLKNNPSQRVEIEGHADERGTNEYNLALGARRAQAVKDYLVTLGIAAERLSNISYGEELPVCRTNSESCWQRNRRAHFVIISSGPAS